MRLIQVVSYAERIGYQLDTEADDLHRRSRHDLPGQAKKENLSARSNEDDLPISQPFFRFVQTKSSDSET